MPARKLPPAATPTDVWLEALYYKLEEIRTLLEAQGNAAASASLPEPLRAPEPARPRKRT